MINDRLNRCFIIRSLFARADVEVIIIDCLFLLRCILLRIVASGRSLLVIVVATIRLVAFLEGLPFAHPERVVVCLSSIPDDPFRRPDGTFTKLCVEIEYRALTVASDNLIVSPIAK